MAKLVNLIPKNLKEDKLQKEGIDDLDTNLPSQIEKRLNKIIDIIKGYNLPRKKETLVIAKVIDAMGMDKNDVMRAISKIKRAGVVTEKNNK